LHYIALSNITKYTFCYGMISCCNVAARCDNGMKECLRVAIMAVRGNFENVSGIFIEI
jgi:hypothetical protein